MPDMALIAGAISSLKTAGDIAKTMIGVRDGNLIQEKVIELQQLILAAQSDALAAHSEQFSLLSRLRELEQEIAELNEWNAEKEKYELVPLREGAFVYSLKQNEPGPQHRICPNCYEQRQKSILQQEIRYPGRVSVLVCNRCGADIYERGAREEGHARPNVITRRPR